MRDPERDYIARTIATVRNHKDAENCWPQWANAFADEIERLDAALEQAERERDAFATVDVERESARQQAEARLASVPALVEALRGMVELNGYRERQLLVNAEWAFAIVSAAQAALTVYEQSQGKTE